MFFWLRKLIRNPRGIGAVAPSSPDLVRLMTRHLPAQGKVLELGPGTGVITEQIVKRAPGAMIELMEADPELAALCATRFPGVKVRHGDAEALLAASDATYDAIVSGIPFGAMDAEKRQRMFASIHRHLAPGGMFVMLQYSLISLDELKREFGSVDTSFTPWMIPPTFVYTMRKQATGTA